MVSWWVSILLKIILPTGWKIKLHITIHKILFSSLEEKSRINFSCYYYYDLSLNQYNLTHYIPLWLMEPLSWMWFHKKITYSKTYFMPRNSVNPIIYGKAVPSDHIKKICFSWMSVFPSIECSTKNNPKYGNRKRLVE